MFIIYNLILKQNDLTFLRIRTSSNEILIAPDKDYYLCVLQKLTKNSNNNQNNTAAPAKDGGAK